jgi:glycine betaine/proline transport system ATP-binding protein
MHDVLIGLQEELKKTIVFITHDLDEALRLGDQIAILRDGAIVQKGTRQEIILDPADDYVADFTKNINRGRILQISSIMRSGSQQAGPALDQDMVLEDALQALSEAGATDAIVTCNSEPIGSVDLKTIVNTITNPLDANKRGKSYT